MQLFVANTTKQIQAFACAVPEMTGIKIAMIPIGQQIPVFGDLNRPQIDAIIEQHRRYGMVSADEVDRTKPFIGMCYSEGKKIPLGKLMHAFDHNREVLEARGAELRKLAAIQVSNQIEGELGRVVQDPTLKAFDVTLTEEDSKEGNADHKLLSEKIVLDHTGDRDRGGAPRPRRRGK